MKITIIQTTTKTFNESRTLLTTYTDEAYLTHTLPVSTKHTEDPLCVCSHVMVAELLITLLWLLEFNHIFHSVDAVGNELVPLAVIRDGVVISIIDK